MAMMMDLLLAVTGLAPRLSCQDREWLKAFQQLRIELATYNFSTRVELCSADMGVIGCCGSESKTDSNPIQKADPPSPRKANRLRSTRSVSWLRVRPGARLPAFAVAIVGLRHPSQLRGSAGF
jgi:hypothetical protein